MTCVPSAEEYRGAEYLKIHYESETINCKVKNDGVTKILKNVMLNKQDDTFFELHVTAVSDAGKESLRVYVKLNKILQLRSVALQLMSEGYEFEFIFAEDLSDAHPHTCLQCLSDYVVPSKYAETFKKNDNPLMYYFNELHCTYSYQSKHCEEIFSCIESALESQDYTDLNIKVDIEIFQVHKIVVAIKSEVFKKIIDTEQVSFIDLKDTVSVETFREVLNYMYRGNCNLTQNYAEIFRFAYKYKIKFLAEDCKNFMIKNFLTLDKLKLSKLTEEMKYEVQDLKIMFERNAVENAGDSSRKCRQRFSPWL